jgi:RimJ/RimL family protein N-acetyltransferase
LIITEDYKGRGYGTQLYSAFINHSYVKKVQRIEWNVLDWNTPALKFYEKSGANILQEWCAVQMDVEAMKSYLAKH